MSASSRLTTSTAPGAITRTGAAGGRHHKQVRRTERPTGTRLIRAPATNGLPVLQSCGSGPPLKLWEHIPPLWNEKAHRQLDRHFQNSHPHLRTGYPARPHRPLPSLHHSLSNPLTAPAAQPPPSRTTNRSPRTRKTRRQPSASTASTTAALPPAPRAARPRRRRRGPSTPLRRRPSRAPTAAETAEAHLALRSAPRSTRTAAAPSRGARRTRCSASPSSCCARASTTATFPPFLAAFVRVVSVSSTAGAFPLPDPAAMPAPGVLGAGAVLVNGGGGDGRAWRRGEAPGWSGGRRRTFARWREADADPLAAVAGVVLRRRRCRRT